MIEIDESRAGDYMGSCRFWVPGKPRGKARPRFNPAAPGARPYTPADTVAYETLVATRYRAERCGFDIRQPHAAFVDIVAYYPIPKSFTQEERALAISGRLLPLVKPDVDNVTKIVLDALNGLAWSDDKRVAGQNTQKFYSDTPGVMVSIRWHRDIRRQRGRKKQ